MEKLNDERRLPPDLQQNQRLLDGGIGDCPSQLSRVAHPAADTMCFPNRCSGRCGKARGAWGRELLAQWIQAMSGLAATMIYTHVLNKGGRGVTSPFDAL